MKVFFLFLFIFAVHLSSDLSAQSHFSAVVTKIIDGDSIVVKRGKKAIEVRLYGIDCPEWNQHFSAESRNYMVSLLYRQKVIVAPQYYDSYGRLVALLSKNNHDVNGGLVKYGIAWVYPKYCRKKVCRKWLVDEQTAREESRGLWQNKSPVSPWRWKRMQH